MGNNLVPRIVFPEVASHLKEKEITIITGARQVGKTTLLFQLKDFLLERKIAKENEIKIFNLDLITDLELFASQKEFVNYLKAEIEGVKRLYLFIDEAQRIKNPGLFFKGIYDLVWPVKLVLTGSSSLEIKAKFTEPLTGRKQLFHLYPFFFKEFITGTSSSLLKLLAAKKLSSYHVNQILERLFEYLIFGGYPRVVMEKNRNRKLQILKEIFSSYIEKDIVGFLKIREALNYSKLVTLLASQIGQLVNVAEISNTLEMKQETIHGYLRVLEQTFVCQTIKPFFRNKRKELTKMPKIYFWDTGLRNFALEAFRFYELREDRGALLENFVFAELARHAEERIKYWRTKDRSEVDFVIEFPSGEVVPIEVKAQKLKKPEFRRSFINFLTRYQPAKALVVNLGLQTKVKIKSTQVFFVYPFQLDLLLPKLK